MESRNPARFILAVRDSIHSLRFAIAAVFLSLAGIGCQSPATAPPGSVVVQPVPPATAPMGDPKSGVSVAVVPAVVQAEVEAFIDRYVLQVSQTTDQLGRVHPDMRSRLDALRLAIARGAFGIAAGPNPVTALLDVMVQTALVRSSVERHMGTNLPEESARQLVAVLAAGEKEAWAIGERLLTSQNVADLRGLVDTWIAENPDVVYVAGIRFADFARMRTKEGSSRSNIFGLLRLDPFSSIDPVAREMHESRLLAERIFYYSQRLPQLLAWQTEALYSELINNAETRQLLANVDTFTRSTEDLSTAIEELPARVRQEFQAGSQAVRDATEDVNATLSNLDQASANLRALGETATQTAQAWEATMQAANTLATTLAADNGQDSAKEPVTPDQIIAMLKESQATATEVRNLLHDLNAVAKEGTVPGSITASVAEARRDAQSIIITATVCGVVLVASVVVGALIYRGVTRGWRTA